MFYKYMHVFLPMLNVFITLIYVYFVYIQNIFFRGTVSCFVLLLFSMRGLAPWGIGTR